MFATATGTGTVVASKKKHRHRPSCKFLRNNTNYGVNKAIKIVTVCVRRLQTCKMAVKVILRSSELSSSHCDSSNANIGLNDNNVGQSVADPVPPLLPGIDCASLT